jgi:hypothetical protein
MNQQQVIERNLSIEMSPEEYERIKVFAAFHGNTINEYILESVRERMRQESEKKDLLKITTSISPVLKELWDNERDAAYDEL